MISPLPPIKEETKQEVQREAAVVKTQKKSIEKKVQKKIVRVEVKAHGLDNRYGFISWCVGGCFGGVVQDIRVCRFGA